MHFPPKSGGSSTRFSLYTRYNSVWGNGHQMCYGFSRPPLHHKNNHTSPTQQVIMVKEKRTQDNLPLKSIWETGLVANVFREIGASQKHSFKMWNYLIKHPNALLTEVPFDAWQCARKASTTFKEDYTLFTSRIVQREESSRGDTTKLIIELQDGHRVTYLSISNMQQCVHRGDYPFHCIVLFRWRRSSSATTNTLQSVSRPKWVVKWAANFVL